MEIVMEIKETEYERYQKAKKQVQEIKGFYVHLACYLFVMIILIFIKINSSLIIRCHSGKYFHLLIRCCIFSIRFKHLCIFIISIWILLRLRLNCFSKFPKYHSHAEKKACHYILKNLPHLNSRKF